MKLPKLTRQQIHAAKGKSVEITLPRDEDCRSGQAYAVQARSGAKRQMTVFVEAVERRGEVRYATVRLTAEPRLLARQQGLLHPEQYTTSEIAALPHDPGEAVDEESQQAITLKAHARFAKHREEVDQEEDQKAQVRAARSKLSETLQGLDGPARVAWLAQFERMCQEAKNEVKKAA